MDTCLYCKEPITQTVGKRKRMFCSNYCRSRHWAKKEVVPDSWQDKYYNIKELYDPLLIRVANLEAENRDLKAKIAELEPLALTQAIRTQGIVDAVKSAPKQVLTTTATDISKEDLIRVIRAEKIPKERDTALGRKAWQQEQEERIRKIQNAY